MDRDDPALLRAIASGERQALGLLYDRHANVLLAVGLRVLSNRTEAEDVLHDVFLEVWRRAHTYDRGRGTVRTWLLVRMRSRCLDRRKSAAYARRETLENDARSVAPEGPEVADGSRVRGALTNLSDDQRDVVILSYFGGLSASEIATRLEIPIGTVKSRMAAAVRKLRQQLAEAHP